MTGPVTITGIGAVTGCGWGTTALWNGLLSGKLAAKLVDGFGPAGADSVVGADQRCWRSTGWRQPIHPLTPLNEAGYPARVWVCCTPW